MVLNGTLTHLQLQQPGCRPHAKGILGEAASDCERPGNVRESAHWRVTACPAVGFMASVPPPPNGAGPISVPSHLSYRTGQKAHQEAVSLLIRGPKRVRIGGICKTKMCVCVLWCGISVR